MDDDEQTRSCKHEASLVAACLDFVVTETRDDAVLVANDEALVGVVGAEILAHCNNADESVA